jgi:hypothetical protein
MNVAHFVSFQPDGRDGSVAPGTLLRDPRPVDLLVKSERQRL